MRGQRERARRRVPRVVMALGVLVAAFLVVRGVAEFWVIDYADPASYRDDWGGPTLLGVLAVHSGPAIAIVVAGIVRLRRRVVSPARRAAAGAARRAAGAGS
jgi:hypothetical protein